MPSTWKWFLIGGALAVTAVVFGIMSLAPEGGEAGSGRPLLHAILNGGCAVLLTLGYLMIRRRWIKAHLACMVLAALVSLTFLGSYLQYHSQAGATPFEGEGPIRPVYFGVLISHTVLAALVAPMALGLFWFAGRQEFERHRRVARWALPLWLYVSVTGVLIYLMLYVWFRAT